MPDLSSIVDERLPDVGEWRSMYQEGNDTPFTGLFFHPLTFSPLFGPFLLLLLLLLLKAKPLHPLLPSVWRQLHLTLAILM